MPPILTDEQRELFVAVLDDRTASAQSRRHNFEALHDHVSAARCRVEEAAFRIVAEVLTTEKIVESTTQG